TKKERVGTRAARALPTLRVRSKQMNIIPTGQGLGATIEWLDLAAPISSGHVGAIPRALRQYGVIPFPPQHPASRRCRNFSAALSGYACRGRSGGRPCPG